MHGSEKQIAWAEQIKKNMLDQVAYQADMDAKMDNDERFQRGMMMITEWLNGQTEAKWFIDNKGKDFSRNWPAHIEKEIYG
jgi:hypothetical protein